MSCSSRSNKLIGLALMILFGVRNAAAYTAFNSSEATLTFSHAVVLAKKDRTLAQIHDTIEAQTDMMFGPLQMGAVLGAPKGDQQVDDHSIWIEKLKNGQRLAHYTYVGTVTIGEMHDTQFRLPLPNNPHTIYKVSKRRSGKRLNPCTDEEYQSEEDFYYLWSPARPGCNRILHEGPDYKYANARIERHPNMRVSYPQYARLPESDGTIQGTIILGKEHPSRIYSPLSRAANGDLSAINYREMVKRLKALGFRGQVWTRRQVARFTHLGAKHIPYVEEFTRDYNGPRARRFVLRMVYTSIQTDRKGMGLHFFYKDALEHSAVMIYDGHSGLGDNLDLDSIRKASHQNYQINFDPNKYQILFMNSCSSYNYYNEDIFKVKEATAPDGHKYGRENLNVLTTGLETDFDSGPAANMALIAAIDRWAFTGQRTTYQELAKEMEKSNLFGVNGDEYAIDGVDSKH